MLILSRRVGEKVRVGEGIMVQVLDIRSSYPGFGSIRLGFDAPENVLILREEVYQRQFKQNNLSSEVEGTENNQLISQRKISTQSEIRKKIGKEFAKEFNKNLPQAFDNQETSLTMDKTEFKDLTIQERSNIGTTTMEDDNGKE